MIEGPNGIDADSSSSLNVLNREKSTLARQLEMLGIRKNMASSEIREIDMKVANLNQMRNIVLDRLAKLEQDEAEVEHESKYHFCHPFQLRRKHIPNLLFLCPSMKLLGRTAANTTQ